MANTEKEERGITELLAWYEDPNRPPSKTERERAMAKAAREIIGDRKTIVLPDGPFYIRDNPDQLETFAPRSAPRFRTK